MRSFANISHIYDYCRACNVPESMVRTFALSIHLVMNGGAPLAHNLETPGIITHDILQEIINKTPRFIQTSSDAQLTTNYRDYVGVHQERIYQLILLFENELIALGIDVSALKFLARYHDSPEGVSVHKDIPTHVKGAFNEDVHATHVLYEKALIRALSHSIITEGTEGQSSEEIDYLLSLCIEKQEELSQILCYFDKLDGLMVCFHEVMSGNSKGFVKIIARYKKIFEDIWNNDKYTPLYDTVSGMDQNSSLLQVFSPTIFTDIERAKRSIQLAQRKLFTKKDLSKDFGVPFYGIWKQATLNIPEFQLGDQVMTGTEILIKTRP